MRHFQGCLAILPALLSLFILVTPLAAQAPLFLVNEATTVRSISFRFQGTQTFQEDLLQARIATLEPGFFDRTRRVLPFLKPSPYPFSPLELQRDVARLRAFYHENGFPHVQIGYSLSRLDTGSNTIRIAFSIDEGPPVRIRSVDFRDVHGRPFPGSDRHDAHAFRHVAMVTEGDRYNAFERLRTRDQVLAGLKDLGYAFAEVGDSVAVDSAALEADLRFIVDPGPLAYFDEVQVVGNEAVSRQVILRELPFVTGQLFSNRKLKQAQHELFSLGLFRTALIDLPAQPRDSTVTVLVRVRETQLQHITYQVGYGREAGVTLQGDYSHRSFFGAARTFTTRFVSNTGYGAGVTDGRLPARLFRASVSLHQPYLFSTRLSGTVVPFVQYERDQQLEQGDRLLGINTREMGVTTALLYELMPFRTLTLNYMLSRALIYTAVRADTVPTRDPFSRSILTLGGTFGRYDDYVNPTKGFLVRPALELAGHAFTSGVRYYKASTTVTGSIPLVRRTGIAARIFVGRIWPVGDSRNQQDPIVENRFDPIRFYSGGAGDLHGWADRLAGPKVLRVEYVNGDTLLSYEPVGGLSKLAGSMELRLPFPGLGPNWGSALFLSAGRVSEGDFGWKGFRFGTGAGIRYRTPVGFVSLEGAYKINPDPMDLRSPEAYYRLGEAADPSWSRHLAAYLSIAQSF